MKNFIINKTIHFVKKYYQYDETTIAKLKYGFEAIYLTITKLIIIFLIAFFLKITNKTIIYILIYNILRLPSFGLHATKSWICLISSITLFIGIPYLSLLFKFPIVIKVLVCIAGICLMFKNSPADTYKRPIISKKRREIYKFISTTLTIIYSFITILLKTKFISNCFLFAIIMQNCMISPKIYKLFKLPYNNYINYLKLHPEFQYN